MSDKSDKSDQSDKSDGSDNLIKIEKDESITFAGCDTGDSRLLP